MQSLPCINNKYVLKFGFSKEVKKFETIDLNHRFGAPWDTFWTFQINDSLIMLQRNAFGKKKFEFHARVQKCHFAKSEKLPIWHCWTHAWNSKKNSSKAFFWRIMKLLLIEFFQKMSQGLPNPWLWSVKLKKEDFLKKAPTLPGRVN